MRSPLCSFWFGISRRPHEKLAVLLCMCACVAFMLAARFALRLSPLASRLRLTAISKRACNLHKNVPQQLRVQHVEAATNNLTKRHRNSNSVAIIMEQCATLKPHVDARIRMSLSISGFAYCQPSPQGHPYTCGKKACGRTSHPSSTGQRWRGKAA